MTYSVEWDETEPDGSIVLAADLDTELKNLKISIRERLEDFFPGWDDDDEDPKITVYGSRERAFVTRSADQTITAAADTALIWENEIYDTGDFVDIAGAATRLTITETGIYLVQLGMGWASGSSGKYKKTRIKLNGSAVIAATEAADNTAPIIGTVYLGSLTAADYLEAFALHNNTATLDVLGGASATHMSIIRLA